MRSSTVLSFEEFWSSGICRGVPDFAEEVARAAKREERSDWGF